MKLFDTDGEGPFVRVGPRVNILISVTNGQNISLCPLVTHAWKIYATDAIELSFQSINIRKMWYGWTNKQMINSFL